MNGMARRTFMGASLLLSADAALAEATEARPRKPGVGASPVKDVEEVHQAARRHDDQATRLKSFDPAVGAVPNPGMGVSGYVFSDHMHVGRTPSEWDRTQGLPPRPLDRASLDEMVRLPHVDNLYIRVEWRDVQAARGKLRLPEAWRWLLDAVEKHGKSWGFRIMNASPHSMHANSLPDFLQGRFKMTAYWETDNVPGPRPKFLPEYNEEYLKYWAELLHLLGGAFDEHPRLEFADISGYGLWGEWHHYAMYGNDGAPAIDDVPPRSDEVASRLIHDHLGAFPSTPAVLSLHAFDYGAGREAFEQGLVWARRDSFMRNFSPTEVRLSQGLQPGSGMVWETVLPMTPSADGFAYLGDRAGSLPQRYFDILAHYAAVGFNPWDMIWAHQHTPDTLTLLREHLGYRIRPSVVWRRAVDGGAPELVLGLRNDGCSPPSGIVTIVATFPDGRSTSIELPRGQPAPGTMHLYALPWLAKPEAVGDLSLSMAIRLKAKTYPIQWAVASRPDDDRKLLHVPLA